MRPEPVADLRRRPPSRTSRLWSGDFLAIRPLERDVRSAGAAVTGRLLDLGCGLRPYAEAFPYVRHHVGYDLDPVSSRPDVCGLAASLPFRDAAFDVVLATQVLEHVPVPAAMLREARRVLSGGGVLLLTAPQYWRLHEEPHDYFRFTIHGLRLLLEEAGFTTIDVRPQGGAWRLVGQAVNNAVYHRFGANVLTHGIFFAVNLVALALERIWPDEGDPMNYMVRAIAPAGR
jgi:SAM-dependent methyltransferase